MRKLLTGVVTRIVIAAIFFCAPSFTTTVFAAPLDAAMVDVCTITVVSGSTSRGTVTGGGTVNKGAQTTITAIPNDGNRFVKWTEAGQTVSTNAAYSFTATVNRTLTAVFAAITAPLDIIADPEDYRTLSIGWVEEYYAAGYELYRSEAYGGPFTLLGTYEDGWTYDMNLTEGKPYYYKVRIVCDAAGKKTYGPFTRVVKGIPRWPIIVLEMTPIGYHSVLIIWHIQRVLQPDGVILYRAEAPSGPYKEIVTITNNAMGYKDTGLEAGKTYYYKVSQFDDNDGERVVSPPSGMGTYTTHWPTIRLYAQSYDRTTVFLYWTHISGGYVLERKTAGGAFEAIGEFTGNSCYDTDLETGVTYSYRVRAYDINNHSRVYGPYSAVRDIKPAWPVVQPTIQPSGLDSLRLRWKLIPGAEGYDVYRSTSSAGPYSLVGSTGPDVLLDAFSFIDRGLQFGRTYYYRIKPFARDGGLKIEGPLNAARSARVIPPAPTSLFAASLGQGSVRLQWTAIPGITMFEVYRATSQNGTYSLVGVSSEPYFDNAGLARGRTYWYKVRCVVPLGTAKVRSSFTFAQDFIWP